MVSPEILTLSECHSLILISIRKRFLLGLDHRLIFLAEFPGFAIVVIFQKHIAGLHVLQIDPFRTKRRRADMPRMDLFPGQIRKVQHQRIFGLMEFEPHLRGAISECKGMPNVDRMNRFRMDVNVQRPVNEIDFLIALRAPRTAGIPPVPRLILNSCVCFRSKSSENTKVPKFSSARTGSTAHSVTRKNDAMTHTLKFFIPCSMK